MKFLDLVDQLDAQQPNTRAHSLYRLLKNEEFDLSDQYSIILYYKYEAFKDDQWYKLGGSIMLDGQLISLQAACRLILDTWEEAWIIAIQAGVKYYGTNEYLNSIQTLLA